MEWQTVQDPGRFEFTQPRREHVRPGTEFALQVPVALRALEQLLHDEERPARAEDVESGSEVAHAAGSESGFIQNGE